MTLLFVGAQWVLFVLTAVTVPVGEPTIHAGVNPFTATSMVVALLLMAFLIVDFRRNRIEAHGGKQFQLIVFGLAAVLLATFVYFLSKVMLYTGPVV